MVNVALQNSNTQAQAVIASEGVAFTPEATKKSDRVDSRVDVQKTDWMQRLLETGGRDLSSQIMKDFMSKVAQAGIAFDKVAPRQEVKNKNSKEGSSTKEGEFSDEVQLSFAGADQDQTLPIKGVGQKVADDQSPPNQEWEEIKEKLVKEGRSAEEISRMEVQFKTSQTRKQMLDLLKDSALLYYLDSDNKVRDYIRSHGFSRLVEKIGRELGKEAAEEARSEMKSFVLHELENQLILRTFLQDGDFKDSYQLVEIGKKVGLDSLEWVNNTWPRKKEDHGLNLLDMPHEVTGYVNVHVNNDNSYSRREREKFEYKEEDEKSMVLNRLRALYMQQALRPGAVNPLTTWFKVRTLKNGLTRLGIFTKDLDERVKQEAKTLAKIKTMEMLEEALHERATFFDKGPAKDLVDNKIKNCLKNLERLGFDLKDEEFMALRDKANRDICELTQKELEAAQNEQGPIAENKVKSLHKLIACLREESELGLKEEV